MDGLTKREVRHILEYARSLSFSPGEYVFRMGDSHTGIFLIKRGLVRGFYISSFGKEVTLAYWGPGHFIGAPELFGDGTHMWSSIVLKNSLLYFLPGKSIQTLVRQIPNFAISVINGLIYKSKRYVALAQMMGTLPMEKRLISLLLTLAEREGPSLQYVITHEEISKIIGSTRQWVSKSLKKLEENHLIKCEKQSIKIIDIDGLRILT
jgi:CRP-like cAMP-binding protein